MLTLFIGTLVLSIVHALIPNHWLPLVAVARNEKWSRSELFSISWIVAVAHVAGTLILGLILGFIGMKISHEMESFVHIVAPLLLIILGLVYLTINSPHHHHSEHHDIEAYKRSKKKWIFYFIFLMLFSPCLEVETFFLSAGAYGYNSVITIAITYALGSVLSIVLLIGLAYRGIKMINNHFIEHNEKKISGIVLVLTGILTFFFH